MDRLSANAFHLFFTIAELMLPRQAADRQGEAPCLKLFRSRGGN
jgi:hypothetical protein